MSIEKSANYRIRVRGKVPAGWADRIQNMTISVDQSDEGKEETTLEGRLRDQAALSGVLNTLHDLNLSILSVVKLEG
jgi:hypothetical protein